MKARRRRVVIVGAGFAGLQVAKGLGGTDLDVLVVDRTNYHLFQPLLYQVAIAGLSPADIASPIREILEDFDNVRVLLGEVSDVDLQHKRIEITDPVGAIHRVESYDWLVLATGAQSSFFGRDHWELHAPGLKSIEDALEIRRRVLLAFEQAERITDPLERERLFTFVVIGGGPTGVELSGAIAELAGQVLPKEFRLSDPRKTKVRLVEAGPRILPSFPEDLSQSAVEQLGELGVEVQTNARVVGIDPDGVELEATSPGDGEPEHRRIRAATVLWAAGVRASDLGSRLGAPVDRQGRVIVESDCSVPGHPEVFVIGDLAHFEERGRPLPGVSPVAMQQGRYVAELIRREAWLEPGEADRPERPPFSYRDKGTMATIGRSRAVAWVRGIKMRGFIAWLAWLFVHVWYLIGFRNRLVVLLSWLWAYLWYERGARLITWTGWRPAQLEDVDVAELGSPASLRPASLRGPDSARAPISQPAPSVH